MSSSLLLQQCPTCLVHLTWMALKMGGKWPYNCCFVGSCFEDLFSIACSILMQFLSSFFHIRFVSINVLHLCNSTDTSSACEKSCFILLDKSDFHMVDSLSIAILAFVRCILTSLSVDEMLLLKYKNLSTNFRELLLRV